METLEQIKTNVNEGIRLGNGYCQASGCSCPSFVDVPGSWPKCDRCGHVFSDHY